MFQYRSPDWNETEGCSGHTESFYVPNSLGNGKKVENWSEITDNTAKCKEFLWEREKGKDRQEDISSHSFLSTVRVYYYHSPFFTVFPVQMGIISSCKNLAISWNKGTKHEFWVFPVYFVQEILTCIIVKPNGNAKYLWTQDNFR